MNIRFWSITLAILIAAFFVRSYDITVRPMHNDEGVNFFFIQGMSQKGFYEYSHENYHGPSFFYITKLGTYLLGEDEYGMRFSSILFGTLTILMLLPLRKIVGDRYYLLSAFTVALSPSLVFVSRYAIHETIFLFFQVAFALFFFLFLSREKGRYLYLMAVSLALIIATKETFVIFLFSMFLGCSYLFRPKRMWDLIRKNSTHLYLSFVLFVFTLFGVYTGGFRWLNGLKEMISSVPQWIGRGSGDVGHFKPFWYYMSVFSITEPYLTFSLLVIVLAVFCFPRTFYNNLLTRETEFIGFISLWFFGSFIVYSSVKYKTPWLIINLTLPAILVMCWWLSRLFDRPGYGKTAGGLLVSILALVIVNKTAYYNFVKPYGSENPFSYVHTSPGMLELRADVLRYWESKQDAKVLIGVKQYWPLPFYFRNKPTQLGYQTTDRPQDYVNQYDILIVDKDNPWQDPAWERKYYRLSDVQESFTYFKSIKK